MDGEVIDEVACKARTGIPHYKHHIQPTGTGASHPTAQEIRILTGWTKGLPPSITSGTMPTVQWSRPARSESAVMQSTTMQWQRQSASTVW